MTGFISPNHTQVPNDLFEMLPMMGEAELKVVMHAVRQTLGYHRTSDMISISQFMKATGLSRQGVVNGLSQAIKHKLMVEKTRGKRGAVVYQLVISDEAAEGATSQPAGLVHDVDQSTKQTTTSQPSRLQEAATSQPSRHTKERVLKESSKESVDDKRSVTSRPPTPAAIITEIEKHPVWQAYKRGWDEARCVVDPRLAGVTLNAVRQLQADIDRGEITLDDIEGTTRWQLSKGRKTRYFITYVAPDIQDYQAYRRATEAKTPRASPPPVVPPAQHLTPDEKARRIAAKERILGGELVQ